MSWQTIRQRRQIPLTDQSARNLSHQPCARPDAVAPTGSRLYRRLPNRLAVAMPNRFQAVQPCDFMRWIL